MLHCLSVSLSQLRRIAEEDVSDTSCAGEPQLCPGRVRLPRPAPVCLALRLRQAQGRFHHHVSESVLKKKSVSLCLLNVSVLCYSVHVWQCQGSGWH